MRSGEILRFLTNRASTLVAAQQPERGLSRRRLLATGAAALAGILKADRSLAAPPTAATQWLVNRLTLGWTPEEQLLADTLGYHGYIDYHLNYQSIDDSALNAKLVPYWGLVLDPYELWFINASCVINETIQTTLLRAVYSKRQLFERMVEFWTDHFCIDITKADCPWIKIVDDRDVIRPHALGNFQDLLVASAQSPAMMEYLDNATSVAGNPNENYARELMELHTLGVSGGYTQQDVQEVARCLTGWGVNDTGTTDHLRFRYNADDHDNDSKLVLGTTIPAGGGINDGLIVLDILAHHPSTANFIATKLCKRFYGYSPPVSLINSVAATFSSTGGDISKTMSTLLHTMDPAGAELKIKRPFHLFVSALRATKAQFQGDPNAFGTQIRVDLSLCGQEPFFHGQPDGYPDKLESWDSLLLPRWNFMEAFTRGAVDDISIDVDSLLAGATTPQEITEKINEVMFGGTMTAAEISAVQNYVAAGPFELIRIQDAIALALSSPTFQWY